MQEHGLTDEDWIIYKQKALIKEDGARQEVMIWLISDLKNGLDVLERWREKDIEGGAEGLIACFERDKKGRRPGLGLSRGFGEFLWVGLDWQDEIMEAIYKIGYYYAAM